MTNKLLTGNRGWELNYISTTKRRRKRGGCWRENPLEFNVLVIGNVTIEKEQWAPGAAA